MHIVEKAYKITYYISSWCYYDVRYHLTYCFISREPDRSMGKRVLLVV